MSHKKKIYCCSTCNKQYSLTVRLPDSRFQVRMAMEVINVFEIDKQKFGAFVAELRKEKGYTQKELASRLFISDKAISKWETGVSIPDPALLIPLSDLLGTSVTELLMSERMGSGGIMQNDTVENIVKTAITYADENPERAYHVKSNWFAFYALSLLVGGIGMFLNYMIEQPCMETLSTIMILCAIFGAYFCFFVKTKLPTFYDENSVNIFYDGAFRMNVPGVKFNNSNWLHIVRAVRLFICCSMIIFPIFAFIVSKIRLEVWNNSGNYFLLAAFFCGLFIPIYVVGKKYE